MFARSVAAYQVLEDVLICSSSEITSGAAAVIHHLVTLVITYCHSPRVTCLLHNPSRRLEWRCSRNHQSDIFQDLSCGTNPPIPSRMQCYF